MSTAAKTEANTVVVVPLPTGNATTDTANALAALDCPPGATVAFQASADAVYVINQELPVPPAVHVTGFAPLGDPPRSVVMPTLQQAAGTNLQCIMGSQAYLDGLYDTPQYNNGVAKGSPDAGIEIDHLAFDGNNGGTGDGNTQGHGVVVFTIGSKVHDCRFVDIAESAVVASDRNHLGHPSKQPTFENRIIDNIITNPRNHGIWVPYTRGAFGTTDGYMQGNIVVSPSQGLRTAGPVLDPTNKEAYEALRLDNSAGWWIQKNLLRDCPGGGCTTNTQWGMRISDNRVQGFGCAPTKRGSYNAYSLTISANVKTHPGYVSGNIASAYEGLNPAGPSSPSATNTYTYFNIVMQVQDFDHLGWFEHNTNVAWQESQPAAAITKAVLTKGSQTVTVPNGSAAGAIQTGMTIHDFGGFIPTGTTVVSVTAGAGASPDTITISTAPTRSTASTTLSFPGPKSIGWSYRNELAGSTMFVMATNEVVTGTIDPTPQINGTGTVVVTDPAVVKDGVTVSGTPASGQSLVATSVTTAVWADPSAPATATVILKSGTYAVPPGVTRLRVSCVGGGGGGGGAAGGTGTNQVGGAGGAAGCTSEQEVAVGTNRTLTVRVGSGGGAGKAGGPKVDAGDGGAGGETSVSGKRVEVVAMGGPGGAGSQATSGQAVSGGAYGARSGTVTAWPTAGCGGPSHTRGGGPCSLSPGGGGGGGSPGSGRGGGSGRAGTATTGGPGGELGGGTTTEGLAGSTALAPGAGGGGGGGGIGAVGGAGGAGCGGFVVIEAVRP